MKVTLISEELSPYALKELATGGTKQPFLITDLSTRNLASKVLSLSVDHMGACWVEKFGHPVWLAETFVDPERFNGGCYKAAGWHKAGQSAGFSRFDSDASVTTVAAGSVIRSRVNRQPSASRTFPLARLLK